MYRQDGRIIDECIPIRLRCMQCFCLRSVLARTRVSGAQAVLLADHSRARFSRKLIILVEKYCSEHYCDASLRL